MASHLLDCAAVLAIPPSKKLVLMAFADSGDKFTRRALPGFETVLEWSGLGRSRAMGVIAELIDDGLLVRVAAAKVGRRAEFVVFPRGCCLQHGPVEAEAVAPAGSNSADPGTQAGSTQSDPGPQPGSDSGSDSGSDGGSTPERTPSDLLISGSTPTADAVGPPPTEPRQRTREKRRTRCPEDWRPTVEQVARAKERSPSIDIDHEVEQFRNFHIGRGTLAADWGRTWATWVGNHAERAQRLARGRSGRVYTGEQWTDGRADAGWDEFERGDRG